jgi:hypothetical protein
LSGVAAFQLEPNLKEELADRTNSTTFQLESSHYQDGTEPKERSALRSDAPTFGLEVIPEHSVDTERTFGCVSIFISMEIKLRLIRFV